MYAFILLACLAKTSVIEMRKYLSYHVNIRVGVKYSLPSTQVHQVLSYQVQVLILKFVLKSRWTYRAE